MPGIPDCLNRRYHALDDLINDLTAATAHRDKTLEYKYGNSCRGVKLMCDFWNILKQNPDCNLTRAVKQRMGLEYNESKSSNPWSSGCTTCYMAGGCSHKPGDNSNMKKSCSHGENTPEPKPMCCSSRPAGPSGSSSKQPLTGVLDNLKEAESFDLKCAIKMNELLETEAKLKGVLQNLEERELEGIKMLKEADCMWMCMEETYKKKIANSLERQQLLLEQLREVEGSTRKWRKNMKDLESQLDDINKFKEEIKERTTKKTSGIKCMEIETADLQKRLDSNKKEIEASKKSTVTKKEASDKKVAKLAEEVTRLEKLIAEEKKVKKDKELEGTKFIKDARDDLQNISGLLLQKKLENGDMKAEKAALLSEIALLEQAYEHCADSCNRKEKSLDEDIKRTDKELAECKIKTIRCNQCTDTSEIRKFCTECPRCAQERRCLIEEDHCSLDPATDCVCMSVKKKFLGNVFENMYTILERKVKKGAGKAVADEVLNCLKRSRNGKLDERTRKILQDFILASLKKNLNLTIVSGAVKTRCEMEPDVYNQLMMCLKQVQVTKPEKVDKGTVSKKAPCNRWGGTNECHCPKGPTACICVRKAPPPPQDPTSCPPEDKDQNEGEVISCPYHDNLICGVDCGMHGVSDALPSKNEMSKWRPDPCQGSSCKFSKDMRTAPCVLDPECPDSIPTRDCTSFSRQSTSAKKDKNSSGYVKLPKQHLKHDGGAKNRPREHLIGEVMGNYVMRKVSSMISADSSTSVI